MGQIYGDVMVSNGRDGGEREKIKSMRSEFDTESFARQDRWKEGTAKTIRAAV